ncbi:TPA: carboxymuconolactone decarboxylase family protein, partial [Escherichia coli]
MKSVLAAAAMSLVISDFANAEETRGKAMMKIEPSAISEADIRSVSPALARFGREAITEDLWTRDALSPRDRSVVTVAMLIARNQPAELKHYIDVALDSGVTPAELSEIITHLAFYSGWPNAMSAVSVTKA